MFRKTLAALIVVAGCSFATSAFANQFAAIAYSQSTGVSGYAYGYQCLAEAESTALSYCGAEDAEVLVWSQNQSCALAVGDDGSCGYGFAGSQEEAESLALDQCSALTTGAHIVASAFSGTDG
jgi:hypothetical protein